MKRLVFEVDKQFRSISVPLFLEGLISATVRTHIHGRRIQNVIPYMRPTILSQAFSPTAAHPSGIPWFDRPPPSPMAREEGTTWT